MEHGIRIRTVILLWLLLSGVSNIHAQPCLPNGFTFELQSQIDSFPILYPDCTSIQGGVQIKGSDIINLQGLNAITSIGGGLKIWFTENLSDLTGLDNLSHIGSALWITDNESLSSISSLSNLTEMGSVLEVLDNPQLASLSGLENITTVIVEIYNNDNLTDMTGLNNLEMIGMLHISDNDALVSLSGLEQLSYVSTVEIGFNSSLQTLSGLNGIKEITSWLDIHSNSSLMNMEGLDSLLILGNLNIEGNESLQTLSGIDSVEYIANLFIGFNPQLSTCDVQSICNYLANPNGSTGIQDNDNGCNSPAEVEEACMVGISEQQSASELSTYPNPFTTSTTIEYELYTRSNIQFTVYNVMGELVYEAKDRMMPQGKHTFTWTTDRLPAGLYYAVLRSEERVSVVKIIKQ